MRNPQGGILAYIGSSRKGWNPASLCINKKVLQELFNGTYKGTLGKAFWNAKNNIVNMHPIVAALNKNQVCIKSLAEADASKAPNFHGIIKFVEVLGYDKNPKWSRDEEGLKIETVKIENDTPVVFKIAVD